MATAVWKDRTERPSLSSPLDSLTMHERAELLRHTRRITLAPGETLCRQGEPSDALFLIRSGIIQVYRSSVDGHNHTYAYLQPPDCVGEAALIGRARRAAHVRSVTSAEVMALSPTGFERYSLEHPAAALRFLKAVARRLLERLEANNEDTEDVLFRPSSARLASALLRVARAHGRRTERGTHIGLVLSHSQLGELVGASRETVCRTLGAWQSQGLLEQTEEGIVIRDWGGVARLASEP